MSGVNWDGRQIRKGAADAVRVHVEARAGAFPPELQRIVEDVRAAAAHRWWWPTARACWAWSS
jgi:high-affinity K+ transport system ATPase subunit B